jgi:hypothetical protein
MIFMERNLKLAWICVLGAMAGMVLLVSVNHKQASELAQLRAQSGQRPSHPGSLNPTPQANAAQMARLRLEHEELLRLRNQVHQLAVEKAEIARKLQASDAQVQQAQAQERQAESQVRLLQTKAVQAAKPLSPAALAMRTRFASRYGLKPTNPQEAAALQCIGNLRRIQTAKEQWALTHHQPNGATVTEADLVPYLGGAGFPKCPSGGTYTLNMIGTAPVCSIPGHILQN